MLISMKKGRLVNISIICSVRKSCVTKFWRQFRVTWSRSSSADGKHSDCSERLEPLRSLGDIGEGAAESKVKKEFEATLPLSAVSPSRRSREAASTTVLELLSSVSIKETR